MADLIGYDGNGYKVGDRVEIHPGTDLWMQGARYGVVVSVVPTTSDRVRVRLDKIPHRVFSGPADRFRFLENASETPRAKCGRYDAHGAHSMAWGWCAGNIDVVTESR